jgi:hypothetical protein
MWVLESEGEAFSGMPPSSGAFVRQLNVMQARNCGCGQGRNSSSDALVQKVRDLCNLLELS